MTQDATVNFTRPSLGGALDDEPLYYGLTAMAWLKIAVVAVLMAATFRYNLLRLWLKTNPFNGEPNWRHAICVPLIGIYYLFVHRDDLLAMPSYTAWSGLGILVFGILMFGYGIYPGQNDYIKDIGMIVALFGIVAMLAGWKVMKIAWFPIVFLICAIPWPDRVYALVASPLQRLAARVAVAVLRLSNVEALNTGTKIIISGKGNLMRTLNVAEACAGLRSLMTFISLAAAVAFLSVRPLWQKLIITFMAIPIAIFCNVMRVTGQGLLDHYFTQELSEGFAHQFVGIVMLVPGFFMVLFVGWLLDVVFIEVVDDREERRRRAAIVKPTQVAEWKLPRSGLAPDPVVETPLPKPATPRIAEGTERAALVINRPPLASAATGNPKTAAATAPKPAVAAAPKSVASTATTPRTAVANPASVSASAGRPAASAPGASPAPRPATAPAKSRPVTVPNPAVPATNAAPKQPVAGAQPAPVRTAGPAKPGAPTAAPRTAAPKALAPTAPAPVGAQSSSKLLQTPEGP